MQFYSLGALHRLKLSSCSILLPLMPQSPRPLARLHTSDLLGSIVGQYTILDPCHSIDQVDGRLAVAQASFSQETPAFPQDRYPTP